MNKSELINALSEETLFTKKDAALFLDAVVRIVERSLMRGEKVQWGGFGTFNVTRRPARKGINPATKEPMDIPALVVAKFKPAQSLKEQVNACCGKLGECWSDKRDC